MNRTWKVSISNAKNPEFVKIRVTGKDKTALLRKSYLGKSAEWTAPAEDVGSIISALVEGAEVLAEAKGWHVVLRVEANYGYGFDGDF